MPSADPLQLLLECAYQPTDARRDAVLGHDWSHLPRIAAALDALPAPITNAALSDVAWRLVAEATEALAPNFPPMPGTITPLEVVRCHVLDRQPWPSLEAQLLEEGRPVSRGTLIRRQHEFLPAMEEWARQSDATARDANERASKARDTDPPSITEQRARNASTRRRTWMGPRGLGAAALVLIVVVALVRIIGTERRTEHPADGSGAPAIDPEHLGHDLPVPLTSGATLPAPYPAFTLPVFDGEKVRGMLVEPTPGEPRLLLAYRSRVDGVVRLCSWDPVRHEMAWESQFDPPVEERLTHATLEASVAHEHFHPRWLFHAGWRTDLGEWFVVELIQKYSPMFVVFVRIDTGVVDGYYVHPGSAGTGIVFDLDRDGRGELVLGAPDNALQRPVLIALQPGPWKGAASTVQWNASGEEGAWRRVLLPDWPEGRVALGSRRLEVFGLTASDYDPFSDVLTVGVGVGMVDQSLYHVRLDGHFRLRPESPFVIWDVDHLTHERHGLQLPDFGSWSESVETIEGIDRRAADRSRR